MPFVKPVIVVLLMLIVASLAAGMFSLVKDGSNSRRTVTFLTFRIALSILVFVFIAISAIEIFSTNCPSMCRITGASSRKMASCSCGVAIGYMTPAIPITSPPGPVIGTFEETYHRGAPRTAGTSHTWFGIGSRPSMTRRHPNA